MIERALALSVAACASCNSTGVDLDVDGGSNLGELPPNTLEWRATLAPDSVDSTLRGVAVVRTQFDASRFTATLSIRGDSSGARRAWHVHFGACVEHGPIVGEDASYPHLVIDDGAAASEARILLDLDPNRGYSVNVHQSQAPFGTIIACGELVLR
jgi:hypothetical protein